MKNIFPLLFIPFTLILFGCSNDNDRYVFSEGENPHYLLDKETGTIWRFYIDESDFSGTKKSYLHWKNMGCPPKEAPKRNDTTNWILIRNK